MDIKDFKFFKNNQFLEYSSDNDSDYLIIENFFKIFDDIKIGKFQFRRFPHDQQSGSASTSNNVIPSNSLLESIETGDLFSQG